MIKLFSLKQQKKDGEATPKVGNQKKASAAHLRITKGNQNQILSCKLHLVISMILMTSLILLNFVFSC